MIRKTIEVIILGILFILLSFTLGCSTGGVVPSVSEITGNSNVMEYTARTYKVQVVANNVRCEWSVEQPAQGRITLFNEGIAETPNYPMNPNYPKGIPPTTIVYAWVDFLAEDISEDTEVVLRAVVTSDQFEPVVVTKRITILDGPVTPVLD
jgi:hypothetical protein